MSTVQDEGDSQPHSHSGGEKPAAASLRFGPLGNPVIVSASVAAAALLGYAGASQMAGVRLAEIYADPDELDRHLDRLVAEGELSQVQFTGRRKDGTAVLLVCDAHLIYDAGGMPIAGEVVLREILEEAPTRRPLPWEEKGLWRGAEYGSFVAEPLTGRLVTANPALEEMTGFSAPELLKQAIWELVAEDDISALRTALARAAKSRTPQRLAAAVRTKEGSSFSAEISLVGQPDGGVRGVLHDVAHAQRLRRLARFLAHLVEAILEPVMATDLDGNITYINPAAERMFGYRLEEVVGKPAGTFDPGLNPPGIQDEIVRRTREEGQWQGTILNQRKNGEVFTLHIAASRVDDEEGNPVALVAVERDVTAEQHAEEEIRARSTDLARVLEISRALLATVDPGQALSQAADLVRHELRAESCVLSLLTEDELHLRCVAQSFAAPEYGLSVKGRVFSLGDFYLSARAIQDKRPVLETDVLGVPFLASLSQVVEAKAEVTSVLVVPLVVQDRAIGVLHINTFGPVREYSARELAFAQAMANQAAVAVENARLHAEAVGRARQAEALFAAASALNSSLELSQVLDSLTRSVAEGLQVPACTVALVDDAGTSLEYAAGYGLPPGEGKARYAPVTPGSLEQLALDGGPVALADLQGHPRPAHAAFLESHGLGSMLAAPIRCEGTACGLLAVYGTVGREYAAPDVKLLAAFADEVGLALARQRLLVQVQGHAEQLRYERDRAQAVLSSTDSIVAMVDTKGRVTYVNPAACRVVGASHEQEIVGTTITDWVHPDDRETVLGNLQRRLEGDTSVYEARALRKDGTTVPLMVSAAPRRTPSGELEGIVVVCADLTGQKALEAERLKSARLAAVAATAVAVQHEVNNPLAVALADARLLQEALRGKHTEAEALVGEIIGQCERIAEVVRELSAVVRPVASMIPGVGPILDLEESVKPETEEKEPG